MSYIKRAGAIYLDDKTISNHILMHKNGFNVPSPGLEATVILFKSKKIKEKFKKSIIDFSEKEPEKFLEITKKFLGITNAKNILKMIMNKEWKEIEGQYNFFSLNIVSRFFLSKPLTAIKQAMFSLYVKLKTFISPLHQIGVGFFVVLIGPHGSGKTTTAKRIIGSETLKRIFSERKYFYRRFKIFPELKKINRFVMRKEPKVITYKDDTNFQFSFFRSILYVVYYGLEYSFARILIRKNREKDSLIVFDRYFYEYFLQRAYSKCPRWILSFFDKIIAQPDLIVFLENSPKVICSRKQEISIKEIERQINVCKKIINNHPHNSCTIRTGISVDEVVENINECMLQKLKKQTKTKTI